jgi:hypothetical protein
MTRRASAGGRCTLELVLFDRVSSLICDAGNTDARPDEARAEVPRLSGRPGEEERVDRAAVADLGPLEEVLDLDDLASLGVLSVRARTRG